MLSKSKIKMKKKKNKIFQKTKKLMKVNNKKNLWQHGDIIIYWKKI